jgi:Fe(3+) dicitrate transport protein
MKRTAYLKSAFNPSLITAILPLLAFNFPATVLAEEAKLEAVTVEDSRESTFFDSPAPKDSDRAVLLRGKKVTQTKLEALPELSTNNHRQAFTKVPGLLVSEVTSDGFASLNYRGQGDPHESFNLLVLQDGAPVEADLYGYPATYYVPPYDWVEKVEFLRGGAGLVYGPLPGGALNYQLKQPRPGEDAGASLGFRLGSNEFKAYNLEGRFGLGSTNALITGHRRLGDGFRSGNSDFDVSAVAVRSTTKLGESGKLRVELEHYEGEFGEAGGLALQSGANQISFFENRFANTLSNDRLQIRRTGGVLGYQRKLESGALWDSRFMIHSFDRNSFRQALGSAPQFGGIANGATNIIQKQGFTTASIDSRIKWNPEFVSERNTASAGATLYWVDSPFLQFQGATPDARTGDLKKDLMRNSRTVSLFAEDRLEWGAFSLTPGVRIENIYQSIEERLNAGATVPLRNNSEWSHVPLFGLGAGYSLEDGSEIYGNISQAYKPATYSDTIPLSTGDLVSTDIKAAKSIQAETGYRGSSRFLQWDSSLFYIHYSNQFGRVGNVIQNTGAARYFGVDGSLEGDLGAFASFLNRMHLYFNFSALNARFIEGPLNGKTPQYAPKYLLRTGLLLYPATGVKIALMNTLVTEHFGDDANSANFRIPAYRVWDLTFETPILEKRLKLVGGVNNLFDAFYWSRVRSNGVDPALPRNFYLGLNARI